MKNKNVGLLIIGISIVLGIIIFLFNNALKQITSASCSMGSDCSMYTAISTQTWISLALAGLIFVVGLFLMFSKEEKQIITRRIKSKEGERKIHIDVSRLDADEKKIVNILTESNGSAFQSDLVEKSGFDKVKVSRILDRLEGRQVIERRRRGMTNIVILK